MSELRAYTPADLEEYLEYIGDNPTCDRRTLLQLGALLLGAAFLGGCSPRTRTDNSPVPIAVRGPEEDTGMALLVVKSYQDELGLIKPQQTADGLVLPVQANAGVVTDKPSTIVTPTSQESAANRLEIGGKVYEALNIGSASMDMTSRGAGAGYNATAVFNILHALRRAAERSAGLQATILEPGVKVVKGKDDPIAQVDYASFFKSLGTDVVRYSLLVPPRTTFDFNKQTGPYLTVTDGYTEYPGVIVGGGVCDLATLMHFIARTQAKDLANLGVSYKRSIQHSSPGINGFNAVDWVAIHTGAGYTFTINNSGNQILQMLFSFDPKYNDFYTNPDPVGNRRNIPPLTMAMRTLHQI